MSKLKSLSEKRYKIVGKATAAVGPRQGIEVIQSPLGSAPLPGFKCEHGVYIPCSTSDPNRAPFCSLCYPYLLQEKTDAGVIQDEQSPGPTDVPIDSDPVSEHQDQQADQAGI